MGKAGETPNNLSKASLQARRCALKQRNVCHCLRLHLRNLVQAQVCALGHRGQADGGGEGAREARAEGGAEGAHAKRRSSKAGLQLARGLAQGGRSVAELAWLDGAARARYEAKA